MSEREEITMFGTGLGFGSSLKSARVADQIDAETCELCGRNNTLIHMHHVKRLKNLREKSNKSYLEQQMIARNRKTIALCKECHIKRHKGEI